MKQIFYIIITAVFMFYGCKPSDKKQDSRITVESDSSSISKEFTLQDEMPTDSIRPIEFDYEGRRYSAKKLSEIMDTLNLRIDKSILRHNVQMWSVSESENSIEVMLIDGSQERIDIFKRTVMNSPAIIFTEESSARPTEEVCDSCGLSMIVSPAVYKLPIEEIEVKIANNTNKEVMTGEYFYLEFYDGSDWKKVPLNYFSNSIGYSIEANETGIYKINIQPKAYKYKAGKYRIFKRVLVDRKKYSLIAEFSLE